MWDERGLVRGFEDGSPMTCWETEAGSSQSPLSVPGMSALMATGSGLIIRFLRVGLMNHLFDESLMVLSCIYILFLFELYHLCN